eukprot:2350853-Pyramimonas_sp.AAC.1
MAQKIAGWVPRESSESQDKCLMWKPSALTAALILRRRLAALTPSRSGKFNGSKGIASGGGGGGTSEVCHKP